METRWHVPTGVNFSSTKIEDRSKELHISADKFSNITAHLSRAENIEAALEAEDTKKRVMKEASDQMTKNWNDSVQHQHAKKQAELADILNKEDDQNLVRFLQVKKEQDVERKVYVDQMRQRMMTRKDFPKALGSAYLFSEVLHEREQQKEFGRVLKQHKIQEEQLEYDNMLNDCAKFAVEEAEKAKKLQEKNKAYAQDLVEQVTAVREARVIQRSKRIQEELIDQERARRERESIDRVKQEKNDRTRIEAKTALLDFIDLQKKERESVQRDNDNCDIVTKIVQKSKDRIHFLMKQREKELMDARLERGVKAFDNTAQLKREAELQLIYQRGVDKFEAEDKAKTANEIAKQKRLRTERLDARKLYLSQHDAEAKQNKEIFKWEMLNRFKLAEDEGKYEAALAKKAEEKKMETMANYDREVELKKERLQFDEGEELRLIKEKNEEDDKEYLNYAEEVKSVAQENGWNTFPIETVISKYRKDVIGEKPRNRGTQSQSASCMEKSVHYSTEPGKRTHCPSSDPSIRCKHQKDRLYK